ncbi:hypothetical protein D0T51_03130 [Parabacteroides sp. 52]|uniref:LptE family protein n=1 Tax=unclassified Parabacteroides TaxID=2649774 RepID=UPI0013D0EA3E|nr:MULTISPECIES: LptE family protein [unclassified Parabacteroides]MDH6533987.1 hypothetical protein [Parabacteroides sp. PM5-20]NDV54728.1 hypothetical protein [Parabacteroides sp. 52]
MAWSKKQNRPLVWLFSLISFLLIGGCSISYKFNSASIDYTVLSSISVQEFPNQAPYVYPPLSQVLTESMRDLYSNKTRLQLVPQNGDLEIEGEITGYDLAPMAVKEDAWASQTKLTITIRVRYTNNKNPEKDFEQSFSAYREFDASRMLTDVQEELCQEIVEELTDQVFNATVADW